MAYQAPPTQGPITGSYNPTAPDGYYQYNPADSPAPAPMTPDRQTALIQALRGFNPQQGGCAPPTPTPPYNPGGGAPPMPALPPQAMGGGMPNFTPGAGLPPQAQASLPPQAMGGARPTPPVMPAPMAGVGVGGTPTPNSPIMPAQVPAGRGRR